MTLGREVNHRVLAFEHAVEQGAVEDVAPDEGEPRVRGGRFSRLPA